MRDDSKRNEKECGAAAQEPNGGVAKENPKKENVVKGVGYITMEMVEVGE